ncbi:MAG: bacterial type II secretion system protein F domain protein [halophilic archaeon J07HX64]|jgi:Bacterial type II secretion system protein F domain.|nr:MAG: bacterial type II secretion system protein F domain protein [halophilic archaeon J07HX64]
MNTGRDDVAPTGDTTVARALFVALARLYPWSVDPSDELRDALRTVPLRVTPPTVVRAGYGAGLVVGSVTAVLALATVGPPGMLPAVALGLVVAHIVHTVPLVALRVRRTAALGDAPALVSRAVLRMRLSPAPERAAAFAAASGEGVLAASLERHVRQAEHTGRSGLERFGEAWADLFPPLGRALALVTAAGQAPADHRDRVLDRALGTVLEGIRRRTREFATEVRGPATALYAFGVLLPTALVAMLPAGAAAGVVVTPVTVVFAYNLLLPVVLVAASAWLVSRRPVAFPPPDLSDHPGADTADGALIAGPLVGVAAWLVTARQFPAWAPPIAAVGLGCGVALWLRYRPVVGVYDEIRAGERELGDALALTGRRVARGQSVETAIAETTDELEGPIGEAFRECARRQRQLQVGVREAFLGPHGALERLPSPRIRGSVALLALAAREGRPAGEALLSLADHVEKLRRVQQTAHHDMAYVCRTLSSTAVLFGPLVAGATVALADGIAAGAFGNGRVSLDWLGAPVGVYVLVLAVVLTTLSTALRRGLDRPLLAHRVGRALTVGTVTYLCAYLLVGVVA